jgi:hypothetical protein
MTGWRKTASRRRVYFLRHPSSPVSARMKRSTNGCAAARNWMMISTMTLRPTSRERAGYSSTNGFPGPHSAPKRARTSLYSTHRPKGFCHHLGTQEARGFEFEPRLGPPHESASARTRTFGSQRWIAVSPHKQAAALTIDLKGSWHPPVGCPDGKPRDGFRMACKAVMRRQVSRAGRQPSQLGKTADLQSTNVSEPAGPVGGTHRADRQLPD